MTKRIMRVVTSPYHGADGMSVLYQPGERFPVDADLPADLQLTDIVVDDGETGGTETITGRIEDVGGPADPELGGRPEVADRTGDGDPDSGNGDGGQGDDGAAKPRGRRPAAKG